MRQAGRYLPQYRALREKYTLLELCANPELAVTVTLQPLEVIDLDAAILFSDLLLPFTPMGLKFDFVKGEGPSVENPVRLAGDVDRLRPFEPDDLGHVLETIRLLRARTEGPRPAHRLWRRAVHVGRIRHRRRPIEGLPPDQDVHVRAAGGVASAVRALRGFDDRLHEGAGQRGRTSDPDLRLVGRRARARRLSRVRAPPHEAHLRRPT